MRRLSAFLLLAVIAASGSSPTPRKTRIRVPMWASEGPVLGARSIQARLNGEAVKVLGVRGPADDQVILLVMDVTGELAPIELAREAIGNELLKLPSNTHVALLRAQDGLRVLHDPTADRGVISTALAAISPSGKAALLETIGPAAQLAGTILDKANVRTAVLLISDSNIYNYREDYTNPVINSSDSRDLSRRFPEGLVREKAMQLSAELSRREAPIFIVHLDYRRDRMNEAYQTGMLEMAQSTAGDAYFCRSQTEIGMAIARAFESIATHYRVDVQLPEKPARAVQVELLSEGRELLHRQRYLLR